MKKNDLPTDWSYAEFHAFVMLYAANADSRITPEEIDVIRPTLSAEDYDAVYKTFKSCSDMEIIDHILSYRDRYFPNEAAKKQLLSDMETIFKADNNFSAIERSVERIFSRMI
jgi:uncharacterized tellurite resistance protein B-like protein